MMAYNTLIVLLGTSVLGIAAGITGVFLLLRKRSLLSDAVSHATLPGIAAGFLVALALGLDDGRHLPTLLAGAALSGILGAASVQWLKDRTRLSEDAAIGVVLSSFFGLGIVMLSYIQTLGTGSRAGLDSFLLGQTAALTREETALTALMALAVIVVALSLRKELTLLCFDPVFTAASGWPLQKMDMILMGLMLAVVCTGLKTVGLILVIALLIIPAATARLWTDRLSLMLFLAPLTGGTSAASGALISAHFTSIPAGAMIVLTATLFLAAGFLFSPVHGILIRRRAQA
ncbi:MAG: metal ABC transporter permease [Micavibrio aeruginosavorus]|uniref:Metal ABC transporter permease n=1 Tax=Micavibrio aeruginosavorus TaxID=349221 RepID=A0A7T5UHL9_9BACT|nr:MAG: metal ABC transporter permease [Micavibrio aeruginosavorus]